MILKEAIKKVQKDTCHPQSHATATHPKFCCCETMLTISLPFNRKLAMSPNNYSVTETATEQDRCQQQCNGGDATFAHVSLKVFYS